MKFKKRNEGFTLVELVVVIAILGILAGVGTVGYSGYVASANKAADKQLLNGIRNAVQLALIQNDGTCKGGTVAVGMDGTEVIGAGADSAEEAASKGFLEDAMEDAFGANWDTLTLKYNGWTGGAGDVAANFGNSSFGAVDDEGNDQLGTLMEQVSTLTTGMKTSIQDLYTNPDSTSGFKQYLTELGVTDPTDPGQAIRASNAAMLYVADRTKGKEEQVNKVMSDMIENMFSSDSAIRDGALPGAVKALQDDCEMGELAAYATLYAALEGFAMHQAQVNNDSALMDNLHTAAGTFESASDVLGGFGLAYEHATPEQMDEYFGGENFLKDLKGYVSAMGAVSDYKDVLKENLGDSDCYTNFASIQMIRNYLTAGAEVPTNGAAVMITASGDVIITPSMD